MSPRLLVVEDEQAIADALAYAFGASGYEVDLVDNGEDAIARARQSDYDLMILDLLLPRVHGLEVCRTVRAESDLPILVLTAMDGETDRVVGLDLGADDYVTKPFSTMELVSRVRALLRRRRLDRERTTLAFDVGELHVDVQRHDATLGGELLRLTRSEFKLVALFAESPGRVFTREELVDTLWEGGDGGDRRAIDVHISNLRGKLEDDPRNPQRLLTVRGAGYMLATA
jgi:two-component system response regulator RegX3